MNYIIKNNSSGIGKFVDRYMFSVLFLLWFTIQYVMLLDAVPTNYLLLALRPVKYITVLYALYVQLDEPKSLLLTVPVAVLLFVSGRLSDEYSLFYLWLLVAAAKNTEFDRTVKMVVTVLPVYIAATVILSLVGVIRNSVFYRDEIVRYSLGFPHPNRMGFTIFSFLAALLYSRHGKIKWYHYALVLACAVFVWIVANSRTSTICMLLLVISALFARFCLKTERQKRFFTGVAVAAAGLTILFGSVMPIIFDQEIPWMRKLDDLMSGRLFLCQITYWRYGVSWIGRQIFVTQGERAAIGMTADLVVDIGYFNILLRNGIVPLMIFSAGYLLTMLYCRKINDIAAVFILFLFAVYGIIEVVVYEFSNNIFLLLFSPMIYSMMSCGDKNVYT